MNTPEHTPSPTPWKLKFHNTPTFGLLICSVVDANGDTVLDETVDRGGRVHANFRFIVDRVNARNGGKA